jgi:hypothetical protein
MMSFQGKWLNSLVEVRKRGWAAGRLLAGRRNRRHAAPTFCLSVISTQKGSSARTQLVIRAIQAN